MHPKAGKYGKTAKVLDPVLPFSQLVPFQPSESGWDPSTEYSDPSILVQAASF